MEASRIEQAYKLAQERYAQLGVDTEKAIDELSKVSLSLHCWQGDDVDTVDGASRVDITQLVKHQPILQR